MIPEPLHLLARLKVQMCLLARKLNGQAEAKEALAHANQLIDETTLAVLENQRTLRQLQDTLLETQLVASLVQQARERHQCQQVGAEVVSFPQNVDITVNDKILKVTKRSPDSHLGASERA